MTMESMTMDEVRSERNEERDKLYSKAEKESDVMRKIVMLHTLDTIYGNKRENLNYVDGLYPAIETLFGVDACIASLESKYALRARYEENYDSSIDYNTLQSYFLKAKELCDNLPIEKNEKIINISDDLIKVLDNVYASRKAKKNVK